MRVTLRQTTDYQRIAHMDSSLFYECDPIEGWDQYTWWIGTCEGIPVCYCGVQKLGDFALLNRSGVLPEYRGNGLQKRMIKKRIEWAIENNLNRLITYTAVDNVESINSLIHVGFKSYLPANMWAGSEYSYWMKKL